MARKRVMTGQCNVEDCEKPVLGRGMCPTHYSYWHRAQKKHTITCAECGKTVQAPRVGTHCSRKCAASAGGRASGTHSQRAAASKKLAMCEWCLTMFITNAHGGNCCSKNCTELMAGKRAKDSRSQLRAAFEDGNYDAFVVALKARCNVVGECWEWSRQKSKGGYPVIKFGRRNFQVHRLVLEAKHQAPLGTQHAHHICANKICVNPGHLQPVTHRENVAEMLARQSYLARIADLEDALRSVDPSHPTLSVIRVA